MNIDEAINKFSMLHNTDRISFLANLAFELTLVGRATYATGTPAVDHPERLRRINEVLHRVSSFLSATLREDAKRYPDDVFVRIVLEHEEDIELARSIEAAFERVLPRDDFNKRPKLRSA